jgi:hypothetical protein
MLPGFRFLFSAIVLSMSILIFGLGAAALLRAAHEEFASNPTWRAPPETVFAQQSEPLKPVLAALIVEPPPAEQKEPETLVAAAPDAPAAIGSPPAEPEQVGALTSEEASPREAAKSEPPAETLASEAAPVQANVVTAARAPATEPKIAAIEASPPPACEAAPVAPEQSSGPTTPDNAPTKIATLGRPPVALQTLPTAQPDRSAIKRRLRAKRARERRRLAQYRAMLAKQAAPQPATDLFGQIIPITQLAQPIAPPKQPIAPPKVRRPHAQAGPVAISGPSGKPHSAHDPS